MPIAYMSSRHIYHYHHHHHYSEIVFIEPGGCLSSSGSLLCTRTTCIFTCNGDNSSRDRFSTTREEQIYAEDGQVLPIMSAEMVIVFAVDCFRQSKRYCVLPSICSSCSLFFFFSHTQRIVRLSLDLYFARHRSLPPSHHQDCRCLSYHRLLRWIYVCSIHLVLSCCFAFTVCSMSHVRM